jgi:hypothetical protein
MTHQAKLGEPISAAETGQLYVVRPAASLATPERAELVRRAQLLAWGGNAWHFVEFAIALGAGIAAGSIALVGFGFDSLIESLAGFIILWRFGARRAHLESAERRAQQLVAASYFVLAAYVCVESVRTLLGSGHPEASWVGIGLAAFTAPTMPLLAREAACRSAAQFVGDRERGVTEHDLRLPLGRTADRAWRERAVRMVVDGSHRSAGDRRRRDPRGASKAGAGKAAAMRAEKARQAH